MSFQGLTPEALVERSDSKNPATTCKGLTTSGKPCRRSLAATPGSSPAPTPGNTPTKTRDHTGVLAILNEGDAAAFFCWQHKDQAQDLVARLRQQHDQTRIVPLQKRSSIDTLAEKVGVLDLDAETDVVERHHLRKHKHKVKKRDTLPTEWQQMQGPLMSVPIDVLRDTYHPPKRAAARQQTGRSNVKVSWSCCIRADEDYTYDGPPPRRRERSEVRRHSSHGRVSSHNGVPAQPQMQEHQKFSVHNPQNHPLTPTRPSARPIGNASPPDSRTQTFLSYIPQNLDPTTTSALLAELSKPFAKDDEAGYIYIFWLTPASDNSTPDDDIASTILDGELDYQNLSSAAHGQGSTASRRAHQLNRYASVRKPATAPKIMLKIGRAQNVHRRMSQWTKQCNKNITLVRYYPHYASEAADPNGPGGTKMPHVNRVERLVHLELRGLGMGASMTCEDCGREHREWFEVEASRPGLRSIDECVRRWVQWAEHEGKNTLVYDKSRPIF